MKYELEKGIIKQTDFVQSYEPKAFNEALAVSEKKMKEAIAQKIIYDAKADNVKRNHPHVAAMSEEKRNEVWLYHENYVASIQADKMIKEIKKNIGNIKKQMKEITKQTGLKF